MTLPPNVIADHPTPDMYRAGLELDVQCARCGSSVDSERCENCDDGWTEGDEDADICGCGYTRCWACDGRSVRHRCLSSPEYCEAHPLPGREGVERGKVEWFVTEDRP